MPARIVRPSALATCARPDVRPVDLEGELRCAAFEAAGNSLDGDTLDTIACVSCEALEGSSDGDAALAERVGTALQPVFHDAGLSAVVERAVLDAILTVVATEGNGPTLPSAVRLAVAVRPTTPGLHRWARRGEAESARAAVYLHERAVQVNADHEEALAHEHKLSQYYAGALRGVLADVDPETRAGSAAGVAADDTKDEDSSDEDEETLKDRETTKRRLRALGEPATFFGEDDAGREMRLRRCELGRDQDVLAKGSTNVMQLLDRVAKRGVNIDRDEEDMVDDRTRSANGTGRVAPSLLAIQSSQAVATGRTTSAQGTVAASGPVDTPDEEEDKDDGVEGDEDANDNTGAAEGADDDCDRDVVLVWLRTTLREWEASVTARGFQEHTQAAYRNEKAQFRQSKQYLRPLRRALRDRAIQPVLVAGLRRIAECCQRRRYKEAKEAYMRVAIGNQPWPIGVTNVSFHDRPNRHDIGEDSVAHILNDETTRKYIQMIKRLLTFAERRWPVDPSRTA